MTWARVGVGPSVGAEARVTVLQLTALGALTWSSGVPADGREMMLLRVVGEMWGWGVVTM